MKTPVPPKALIQRHSNRHTMPYFSMYHRFSLLYGKH
jgi:hypothetical protein